MRWETSLRERAFKFGLGALHLYPKIAKLGQPYTHVAQRLFEAATSIGAQLEEADVAASRRDMAFKQAVGLREAKESRHWLRLLIEAEILAEEPTPMYRESGELVAMLTASVRRLRSQD